MAISVGRIRDHIQADLVGDESIEITQAMPLQLAEPGHITFLERTAFLKYLASSRASAVVVPRDMEIKANRLPSPPPALLCVDNVLEKFLEVITLVRGKKIDVVEGVSPSASIHETAIVGENCSIRSRVSVGEGSRIGARCRFADGVSIGRNCRIGDDVVLHPNAVVYDDTVLGNRVIIHANTTIGADGFGYRTESGEHKKIPQVGWVEIGDDVEIGAVTSIDRGAIGPTRIGKGTKIDNNVQVGHNCQIGDYNLIAAGAGIAGSCSSGAYTIFAGHCGVNDHTKIGSGVIVGAQAGVVNDLADGAKVLGTPARDLSLTRKIWVSLARLPDLVRDMRTVKKLLEVDDKQQDAA